MYYRVPPDREDSPTKGGAVAQKSGQGPRPGSFTGFTRGFGGFVEPTCGWTAMDRVRASGSVIYVSSTNITQTCLHRYSTGWWAKDGPVGSEPWLATPGDHWRPLVTYWRPLATNWRPGDWRPLATTGDQLATTGDCWRCGDTFSHWRPLATTRHWRPLATAGDRAGDLANWRIPGELATWHHTHTAKLVCTLGAKTPMLSPSSMQSLTVCDDDWTTI